MHLAIITPIFPPTTGGAATYYDLLSTGLLASGEITKITVITERVPDQPNFELKDQGRRRIIRMFPHRAGRHLKRIALYWRYGIQNLQYIFLPGLISQLKPDIMLVHSSVHIYSNMLCPLIPFFSKRFPVVADVRDYQLPVSRLHQLNAYSALIACSSNVMAHVSQARSLAAKATHIPVLQDYIAKDRPDAPRTLAQYGLRPKGYLLYSGLIKEAKGVGLLLEAFAELRERGMESELVLAGFSKDDDLMNQVRNMGGVHAIGAVRREELLDLMSAALMNINLSASESISRTSLEALALGTPVLLPSGIPEYEAYCPEAVVRSRQPKDLADQIQFLLAEPASRQGYPIATHAIESVVPQYIQLFNSLVSDGRRDRNLS